MRQEVACQCIFSFDQPGGSRAPEVLEAELAIGDGAGISAGACIDNADGTGVEMGIGIGAGAGIGTSGIGIGTGAGADASRFGGVQCSVIRFRASTCWLIACTKAVVSA